MSADFQLHPSLYRQPPSLGQQLRAWKCQWPDCKISGTSAAANRKWCDEHKAVALQKQMLKAQRKAKRLRQGGAR